MTNAEIVFKQNIKYLRERNHLTCYALANKLGIDRSYYYRLESLKKHQNPGFEIFEKIALFYNIEYYELFRPIEKTP